MKKVLVIIVCLAIVCAAVFLGGKYLFPEQYEKMTEKFSETKEQGTPESKTAEDYQKSFLLAWGMSVEDAEKIIIDDWNGTFHADQETENDESIFRVYTVPELGDLGKQKVKMFLEFDQDGLYYIQLYFEEGDNQKTVELAQNGLGEMLSETQNSMGDTQKSLLTKEGTAVVLNEENQIIFYNAYSKNSATRENNTMYNIL